MDRLFPNADQEAPQAAEAVEAEGPGVQDLNNDPLAGPVELNLLERVEYGLAMSDHESTTKRDQSQLSDRRFEGQREVIFISGWANISQIYRQQKMLFASKTLIALSVIYSFKCLDQRLWPLAATLLLLSFVSVALSAQSLWSYWLSDRSVKLPMWVDLNESICYMVLFGGFALYCFEFVGSGYLGLFPLPGLVYSGLIFLYYSEESPGVMSRRFMIVEWVQLQLIALRICGVLNATWNYTLILYMAGAIYMTVLGMFLSMILGCGVIGIFQRRVEGWKVRALLWMTWNYLTSGFLYVYIVKEVIHYYNDDGLMGKEEVKDVRGFQNPEAAAVVIKTMIVMASVSIKSLFGMFVLKKDIIKFFTRIVYRHEARKEVSLRFLNKSFTFKLIQASATYFLKPGKEGSGLEAAVGVNAKQSAQPTFNVPLTDKATPNDGISQQIASGVETAADSKPERDVCFLCCESLPNVMLDPCGHGGACKDCLVSFLKGQGENCPFCKKKIHKVYVLDYDEEDGRYRAKGEIKLGN